MSDAEHLGPGVDVGCGTTSESGRIC